MANNAVPTASALVLDEEDIHPSAEETNKTPAKDQQHISPDSSSILNLGSKWLGFVSALWVQAIAGNNYTFANYSVELKAIMGVNQVQLNGLSSAKDVGKAFGVVAGFLCNYIPAWAILLIGSLEGLLGYGAQWLVISRKIKPLPYWLMCIVLCMGGNSTTWMNTAVLVTCVRNFQRNRGPVSGILKAYVGLSTAIFTDLCTALFGGDAAAFVLMLALIPLGVCIVAMFLLKPVELNVDGEHEESRCFSLLNAVAIALALYLLAYDFSGIKKKLFSRLIAGGICIILVAPVALPLYLHIRGARRKRETTLNEALSKKDDRNEHGETELVIHKDIEEVSTPEGDTILVHRDVDVSTTEGEMMVHRYVGKVSLKEGEAMVPRNVEEQLTKGDQMKPHKDSGIVSLPSGEDDVGALMALAEGQAKVHTDVDKVCTSKGEAIAQVDANVVSTRNKEGITDGDAANKLSVTKGKGNVCRDAEMVFGKEELIMVQGELLVEKVFTLTEEGQAGGMINTDSGKKKLGDDFTVLELLRTFDFWLLFFCFLCGVGTGMAVINNMGQIGQSLGYSSVSMFVSLISIWGFFGRLGSGVLSEYLIGWRAVPRPVLLAVSQLVMALGYVWLAVAAAGSLYVGSIVVGVCYGVRLSVSVPVASELFGLKAFGMMYNLLIINLPLGSVLFSSLLAGFLYDREAAKQLQGSSTTSTCLGAHCYRLVFLLMAAVSAIGFVLDAILALRTRALYQQIQRSKQHCNSKFNQPH